MFYLGKIRRIVMDKNGADKVSVELYLIKNAETFGDAENQLLLELTTNVTLST